MQEKPKLIEKIVVYFTPEEKERIGEHMLKHTYDVSLSTMLRELILKTIDKK